MKAILRKEEYQNDEPFINGFGEVDANTQFNFRYDDKDNFYIIIDGKEYEEVSTAFDFVEAN